MNRGGAEARRRLIHEQLTEQIIGSAIEVHRVLGPGLLESAYEESLCHEFSLRKISFRRQVELPVEYKGVKLDCGYRIDLLVEEAVIVELKCVERLLPVHDAQLLTYMKLARKEVGLIFNFHTEVLTRGGVVRKALTRMTSSAPLRLRGEE
ncbi:MAG: GxxExxY protein [Acidobacteria bacterium]|nr:GxxExxY protein [Acidobacteriota bacterium]